MPLYRVTWEIDLDADDPVEAARTARRWIHDEVGQKIGWAWDVEAPGKKAVRVDLDAEGFGEE